MNIMWQAPQYFFVGVAKVFSVVGFIEFAYEQSPDAMRSLCQACSLIMVTLGSYLVSVMLMFIDSITEGRGSQGWIPENMNEGRLDKLFWLMAGLQLLNLLAFGYCSMSLAAARRAAVSVRHCAGVQQHIADSEERWSAPLCAGSSALLVPGRREEMAFTGDTSYGFGMEVGDGAPVAECSLAVISKDDTPAESAFHHSVVFPCSQQVASFAVLWRIMVLGQTCCKFNIYGTFLYLCNKLEFVAFRFFDRAATIIDSDKTSGNMPSPWKLCTVTQVEELKILARMLPVLLAGIIFNTAEAFFPLFVEQGQVMDNNINGFSIPPATLTTFNCLCILILAPSYNKVLVPILSRITGMKRGLSELQRIGVGMVFAMLSLISAALVEMVRLDMAKKRGLVHHNSVVPVKIMWQGPQYIFVGVAKVFTVVGFIEFAYEQSPDAMRSLCQACSLIMITLGSYLVSITLKFINSVTGERGSHGWIPENLNEGRLDQFFWLMAGLQLLNVLAFVYCATRYKRKLATYGVLLQDCA
ncbi:hypothetical protein HU200_042090 [Digitaria exilis]|uniref:Uncharacterized protein n=1 Tax=Digitaria exilis TaxID=1010633 RepID=A0A835B6M3_9POAL|nr:hypothetical protein HU200_042090 [Digitaria exilis]